MLYLEIIYTLFDSNKWRELHSIPTA